MSESREAYIKRLEDHLHAIRRHPDYEYLTTTIGRKTCEDPEPYEEEHGVGWEENGEGHDSWERFDYHEEYYWRRLHSRSPE